MRRLLYGTLALALAGAASTAHADSVAGLCPDGSAFIVQRRADAPCDRAKFVDDPSELPPLRPELLPRPYTWQLDHQARDPNNPYNLLDQAEQVRASQDPAPGPEAERGAQSRASGSTRARAMPVESRAQGAEGVGASSGLALHPDEIRDLVRLVVLRQQVAPATFTVEDIRGNAEVLIRLAHSAAFETRLAQALGLGAGHVLLFSARSPVGTEFFPNFFLVRSGATFRPEPEDRRELGFLVGDAGELPAGNLALGYLVVPERFDPTTELEIWWNDRSLAVTLQP